MCIVLGPCTLPLLRNLTVIEGRHLPQACAHFPRQTCIHLGLQEDKNTYIYELVDFIEVIQIKMFALYAEVSFDRFGKELHFIDVCLGDFVVLAQF